MDIKIDKELKTPIYMQVSSEIKGQIMSGNISAGSILPSERALAKMLNIHRNTITRAYNDLKDEGVIESNQGVGYKVVSIGEKEEVGKKKKGKVNWADRIKDEYLDLTVTFDDLFQRFSREDKISMGSGIAARGIYDKEKLAGRIAKIVTEQGKKQYFYSPYQGDEHLRKQIVSYLSTKGIKATTGQIQILSETNQTLDFLVTLLIKPGDAVITEEPVSPDTYRTMELAGAKVITIPLDEEGVQCEYLQEIIEKWKPKLICLNSCFHDPTTKNTSPERKKKILELSGQYRIPIIECDEASELYYDGEGAIPMKVFDTLDNVVYIYSFSLTFVPGLSLAFIVADKELIQRLSYLVSVRLVATDWLAQRLVADYLEEGVYYRKLSEYRSVYKSRRDVVCNRLEQMRKLGIAFDIPKGGIYVWCKLPAGIDSKELIANAYSNGLSLLPGYVFYPSKSGGRDYIRINYSYETEERLIKGLDILEKTILELQEF